MDTIHIITIKRQRRFKMGSVSNEGFPTGILQLQQNDITKVIPIEIAANPFLWRRGLMNRNNIPLEYGMLYVFPEETIDGFWMAGVRTPLNIAFIDSGKKIINIQTMAPCIFFCPMYYSPKGFLYALETKAGFFEKFGFREGCKISYQYN